MLVDSHCHLTLLEEDNASTDLDAVLGTAKQQGVQGFLCVSVDFDTLPRILAIASERERVFASVGIHPNTTMAKEPTVDEVCHWTQHPKVIAIGETGLDYYRSEGDLSWQQQRFRTHIAAAQAVNMPLIIHTRDAAEDTLRIMAEEDAGQTGGIMHCFVDNWDVAQRAIELGFYISLSGIVTFKNAQTVQDVARRMPLERLLVETDAPFLAPVPYRGKPNQPAYVRQVAEFIAKLRGISLEQLAEATTENFFRLFPQTREVLVAC